MVRPLSDTELCQKAWEILEERLGPVEAIRFLSMTRSEPRDYQAWRDARFADLKVEDLFREMGSERGE